jgi:hypothetical protein
MENHPAWWQENGVYDTMSANLTGTRGTEEKITADYFQWQTRFQRFNVLSGLRYEHTSVYSRGYVLLPASERTTTAERQANPVGSVIKDAPYRGMTGNYDKIFPGIHFIYLMLRSRKILPGLPRQAGGLPDISRWLRSQRDRHHRNPT